MADPSLIRFRAVAEGALAQLEGRRQEVVWLVEEMLRSFLALGIARESIASLLLLKKSCQQRRSVEALCGQIEALARLLPELSPGRGKKEN